MTILQTLCKNTYVVLEKTKGVANIVSPRDFLVITVVRHLPDGKKLVCTCRYHVINMCLSSARFLHRLNGLHIYKCLLHFYMKIRAYGAAFANLSAYNYSDRSPSCRRIL